MALSGRRSGIPSAHGLRFRPEFQSQSPGHRIEMLGKCQPPPFYRLLREFLDLMPKRLHSIFTLRFQRPGERVLNPVLDRSQLAAYLVEPGCSFLRAAYLQVFQRDAHRALELSARVGNDFGSDLFQMRVKFRLSLRTDWLSVAILRPRSTTSA